MKKLILLILPITLMTASCGDQRPKETIRGSRGGAAAGGLAGTQNKAITSLFTMDALMSVRTELEAKSEIMDMAALKSLANKKFAPLLTLNKPRVTRASEREEDSNARPRVEQKPTPTSSIKTMKVISIRGERDDSDVEANSITMHLKINNQNVLLSGGLTSERHSNLIAQLALDPDEAGVVVSEDNAAVKTEKVEALSLCVTGRECTRILSVIRLGDSNFKVIVTDRANVKKKSNSGASSKDLRTGAIDIHEIMGEEQLRIVISLNFADGSVSILSADVEMGETLQAEFTNEAAAEVSRVLIITSTETSTVRIFNLEGTSDDDLILEVLPA